MNYELKLESFQGPLDLLYQLVKKNKIEISEISLAEITGQYLTYLDQFAEFNLELASEFMVIAAELIEIKARNLLPGDKEDQDIDEDDNSLINRLKEYHFFKNLSGILQGYEKNGIMHYPRPANIKLEERKELELKFELDLEELRKAYQKVMSSVKEQLKQQGILEDSGWTNINIEKIKVEDKINEILERLSNSKEGLPFAHLINNKSSRMEIVVTFLSILELAKMKQVYLAQDRIYARNR